MVCPNFRVAPERKGNTMISFYAIATDSTGTSKLYGIDLAGTSTPLFTVGSWFKGGLAYYPPTRLFYAIAQDTSGFSSLYRLSLDGHVQLLFGLRSEEHTSELQSRENLV